MVTKDFFKTNEGYLILDMSMFFPFANQNILTYGFELTNYLDRTKGFSIHPTDFVFNHRYPNKGYITISKKTEKKVDPYGYTVSKNIEILNRIKYLTVCIGVKDREEEISLIKLSFPVNINLTKNKPYAYLKLIFFLKDMPEDKIKIEISTAKMIGPEKAVAKLYLTDVEKYKKLINNGINKDTYQALIPNKELTDISNSLIVFKPDIDIMTSKKLL